VYAIPIKEGMDPDEAGDIAQETFAELLRSVETIREPDRLGYWLATVCRRAVWKRRNSTRQLLSIELSDNTIGPTEDFADELIGALEVYDAVQDLGEPCRSLIIGLFFDPAQPDYTSIAMQLGRPSGSIGPLRGRCLARLRALLMEVSADA